MRSTVVNICCSAWCFCNTKTCKSLSLNLCTLQGEFLKYTNVSKERPLFRSSWALCTEHPNVKFLNYPLILKWSLFSVSDCAKPDNNPRTTPFGCALGPGTGSRGSRAEVPMERGSCGWKRQDGTGWPTVQALCRWQARLLNALLLIYSGNTYLVHTTYSCIWVNPLFCHRL